LIQGYGLKLFEQLDSTNEEARRLALAGEAGPLWIMAQCQSAGRGRQGRPWQSDSGNLFATLLLTPSRVTADWSQLSFVAAIAVAEMAAGFTPSITVKWPNDVLAEGRKLSGILLETAGAGLAIGIGINLASHPTETEFPAISLGHLGAEPPTPAEALELLAASFAGWYDIWEKSGFAPIRAAWLALAAGLGGPIRARLPGREYAGLFEGIDEQGALLLREEDGLRVLAAGEVFFG
jgi:BirA family transcriptional regulator, biotin operon repressor / biotin---[acetyl-CoA-carboxylase] ligase